MQTSNPFKVFWANLRNIPTRISRLINLSAADGAIFLDTDGNYTIVPFGSNQGEIAEGNHSHSDFPDGLKISDIEFGEWNESSFPGLRAVIGGTTNQGKFIKLSRYVHTALWMQSNNADDAIAIIRADYADPLNPDPSIHVASVDGDGVIRLGPNKNEVPVVESGTFTPKLHTVSDPTEPTYIHQFGSYRKLGDLLFFSLDVRTSSAILSGDGILCIFGLPYLAADEFNSSWYFYSCAVGYVDNFSINGIVSAIIPRGRDRIQLYRVENGSVSSLLYNSVNSGSRIMISGCYPVSQS